MVATEITQVTRRRLFRQLRGVAWWGDLDESEFLARLGDLASLPSSDPRFSDAARDHWQHRVNNPGDWDDDWIFDDSRFELQTDDKSLLKFLCELVHPEVRDDSDELVDTINEFIRRDGWELAQTGTISGLPLYSAQRCQPALAQPGPRSRKHPPYALDPKPLGTGGQADVFRGVHRQTGRVAAVKKLKGPRESDRARFAREIELMRQLVHPSVMPVLEVDPYGSWYAMPLAAGDMTTLWPSSNHEELGAIVRSVGAALAYAHDLDILHRDVKPSNILKLSDGAKEQWVIADFGIARRPRGDTTVPRTKSGVFIGSEPFAAPELWDSAHEADTRADIYSLGRVVLWAITGRLPKPNVFDAPDGPWRAFVREATQTDPGKRPETFRELFTLIPAANAHAESPSEVASRLIAAANDGNEAAAQSLMRHLAQEDVRARVLIDELVALAPGTLPESALTDDLLAVAGKVEAVLLDGDAWNGRDFGELNGLLRWLRQLAKAAAAHSHDGLLEDVADVLFRVAPRCSRYDERRETRQWLINLAGRHATIVARALARQPTAVTWYRDEGWTPSIGAEPILRALGL